MNVSQQNFGRKAMLITLENDHRVQMNLSNFGARITDLYVPMEEGLRNIVLGFDTVDSYIADPHYGATIGRLAGRIGKGRFDLNGTTHHTSVNEKGNTLHGGVEGFDKKYWDYEMKEKEDEVSVTFSLESEDGESGFPGNLTVKVTYTLDNDNVWTVKYEATSDEDTIFNPTNHVYFNLTGKPEQQVDGHSLKINASEFAPVHEDTTVTGEKRRVPGTPFDFRSPRQLDAVFVSDYEEVRKVNGIDHPFFLSTRNADDMAVKLSSPEGDMAVEVYTEEPALVVYTANDTTGLPLMRGKKLAVHGGVALETQKAPGAVEFEGFGDVVLPESMNYTSMTKFKLTF